MTPLPVYPVPATVTCAAVPTVKTPAAWSASAATAPLVERFFRAAGLPIRVTGSASLPDWALASQAKVPPAPVLPRDGYSVIANGQGFSLQAANAAGFYSGLQSLWQILDAGAALPEFEIVDGPVTFVRSFQVDLARQPETCAELKRLVRQQARYHYNECQLYLENSLKLEAFGDAADPDGLTPDELRDLQAFAADLGVDVVPSLNLLGHMEKLLRHPRFAPLSETAHGARHPGQTYEGCLCPELPESKALVRSAIRETAALSRSSKLMVGLDECWTLGSHPLTRKRLDADGGAGTVFRDWIRFLHAEVTGAGKQMWMWEDMLFYHRGALRDIPTDIGMNIWHYQHIEEVAAYSFQNWRRIDSMALLAGRGHPFMLCCGPETHHLHSMLRYAEGYPLHGLLVVQWGGGGTVQEYFHLGRAMAAGVLWSGRTPEPATVARRTLGVDAPTSEDIGTLLAQRTMLAPSRGGGTSTCPRFWSWPENEPTLDALRLLAPRWRRHAARHEAMETGSLFLDLEQCHAALDWARETAALAGRRLLQQRAASSRALDEAVEALEELLPMARQLPARSRALLDRYTAGLKERPMGPMFQKLPEGIDDLLARLKAFQAAPSPANWPFCRISLHLDGLSLDPCAHHLRLSASPDGSRWSPLFEGNARLPPSMEGEFTMSFPVDAVPRQVRIEVGSFAAIGFTRVRIETLDGTLLPARVVSSAGQCFHPEHLLEFDRKAAIFGEPDVMSDWLHIGPETLHSAVLEFDSRPAACGTIHDPAAKPPAG